MKLNKLYRAFTVILCVVCIISLVLLLVSQIQPLESRKEATTGNPFFFVESPRYLGAVTDVAVCDDYLYLLYEAKGILACYGSDGEYSHSYAIRTIQNGKASLFVNGDMLCLESRDHYTYIFHDGVFMECLEQDYGATVAQKKVYTESLEKMDVQYEIRGASVWRVSEEGSSEVIHRPALLAVFQGDAPFWTCWICFFVLFLGKVIEMHPWKRSREKTSK